MLREGDGGNGGLVGVRGARGGDVLEGFWFDLNFVRFCNFGSCLIVSLSSRRDFLSFFFDFFEWLDLLSGLSSHLYPAPLKGITLRGVPDLLPLLDKDLSCCSTSFS